MAIKHVTCKLGNMRKPQEWVVYPKNSPDQDYATIQSNNRICRFNLATGEGLLSQPKSSPHFAMLHPLMKPTKVVVPSEIVEQVKAAFPKSGDEIGPGIYIP